ncbi:Ig domain-containing protein [Crenothrix polyspora]|uniref:PKD domain-containing protein n=1 Tax=Crenothrix polyspora TaxID=360316 RepID=A0A1R4HK43_9GAMM|nr:Ig domain-containing protein [Crenothrix polyspora]SJM96602.1 hypothetical protein CRENPOLYSF1_980007 [Crenothrix polyspora]
MKNAVKSSNLKHKKLKVKEFTTIFLPILTLALTAVNSYAKPVLTKQMTVEFAQSQPRFDTKAGNFVLSGVLHNTSETMVNAPVALVVGDFSPQSSIMLLKPDGFVPDGSAYQWILKKGTFAVGAKIPFTLRFDFSNPVNKLAVSSLEALAKKALQFKPSALANVQFQYRVLQIPATNRIPIANAGTDKIAVVGTVVRLDGGASLDKDGDPLSYVWTLKSAPGSQAKLSKTTTAMTTFKPDLAGDYIASLTINDAYVQSVADAVKITVKAGGGVNHNPVITSYSPDSATATRSFSYEVTAIDADKDKLTYTLEVSPSGMSINASGGINWSVPNKPHAHIPVTVKVTDGKGGAATQDFSLHIQPCACK